MKCNFCGHEESADFAFCPVCGQVSGVPLRNSAVDAFLPALKDTLFLVLCILLTAHCALSLVAGSLPLLNVLMAIFLWLTYAKGQQDQVPVDHMRQVSGTVYATYVLNFVLVGLLVLLGVLVPTLVRIVMTSGDIWESVMLEVGNTAEFQASIAEVEAFSGQGIVEFISMLGIVLCVVFLVIAVLLVLINLFSYRYIHRFAKSAYRSVESGILDLKHVGATRGWLIAFAVFSGISTLSNLSDGVMLTALGQGCLCAAYIVSAIWIRKHFQASAE